MRRMWMAALGALCVLFCMIPVAGMDDSPWSGVALSAIGEQYRFDSCSIEEVLEQFCAENGLDETNFSVSCYITGTGELYSFGGDVFRTAASTYKLPLNMVYYDKERSGEISSTAYIDGYYLPTMHYETIVNSNNDMAISMLYHLGSFRTYRQIMTQFYDQEYPATYYAGNNINSDYMLAVLWELYCNSGNYEELIENMKIAAKGQYFQLYQEEYEIAHKYGYYEGAVNDVGIIYTPEPVLVAAYTENVGYGERKLGELAQLLTEYSVYHTNCAEAERLWLAAIEAEAQRIKEQEAAVRENIEPVEQETHSFQEELPESTPEKIELSQPAEEKATVEEPEVENHPVIEMVFGAVLLLGLFWLGRTLLDMRSKK